MSGKGLLDRFGQVKGTDFIQFYVAGQLVAAGRGAELYRFVPRSSFQVQFAAEAQVLGGQLANPNFAFVVPPFFALLLVPFSRLPYLGALGAWIGFNVVLLVATLRILEPYVALLRGRDRWLVYLAAAAFFPFLESQFDGQNGVISLFSWGRSTSASRRERDTLAGLALAGILFKPQLVVTLALAMLLARRWRVLLGLASGGLVLVGVSWLLVGPTGMRDYLSLSATMPGWIYLPGWRVWNMHSWQSFFVLLFPNPLVSRTLTALFSLGTLGVGGRWRAFGRGVVSPGENRIYSTHPPSSPSPYSAPSGLVSPHVFAYDLTLLYSARPAPRRPAGHVAELARRGVGEVTRNAIRLGLALTFLAPLPSRFLAMGLHLQMTVPIIAALFLATALALQQVTAADTRVESAAITPMLG